MEEEGPSVILEKDMQGNVTDNGNEEEEALGDVGALVLGERPEVSDDVG